MSPPLPVTAPGIAARYLAIRSLTQASALTAGLFSANFARDKV
jgi:hypothetical protein